MTPCQRRESQPYKHPRSCGKRNFILVVDGEECDVSNLCSRRSSNSSRWFTHGESLYPVFDIPVQRIHSLQVFDECEWGTTAEETEKIQIEIMPGLEVPLRGSAETKEAIRRGTVTNAECMQCTKTLNCIDDAEYVLCPSCRCVSPVGGFSHPRRGSFGVGLGFESHMVCRVALL